DVGADRESRGPRRLHQVADPVEARGGGGRRVLGAVAQHPDRRAQVAQRVPARLLDRREGGPGLLRVPVEAVQRGPGLDVDVRDVVPGHVVQLAGDAQPLLAGLALLGLRLVYPTAVHVIVTRTHHHDTYGQHLSGT